jgi:hypothetical protein
MNTSLRWPAYLAMALALFVPKARAGLILDLNTGGTPAPCGGCGANGTTFGWSFQVTSPVTVTGIGVWDAGSDGLGVSTDVGLYTAAGSLLASATISDSSMPVASASTDGRWLFESVQPITLTPGDYLIGNVFLDSAPIAQTSAPFLTIPQITLLGGAEGTSNAGLTAPLGSFSFPIFGPTLQVTSTPEPGAVSMLGLGLALIGLRYRIKRL